MRFPTSQATATEDPVGKAELGMKLTCESCGARFYDLNKQPASCPKCGAANSRPTVFKTTRRSAAEEKDKRPVAAAPAPEPDEEDVVVEDAEDEEDEAVIEDTSDLGEDDDVEVVVEDDET
jgi:uncharacterized protein (TIGR02300 family)